MKINSMFEARVYNSKTDSDVLTKARQIVSRVMQSSVAVEKLVTRCGKTYFLVFHVME